MDAEEREKQRSHVETIRRLRTRIERLEKRLEREPEPLDPERIIWIFGSARTGSTWLSRMLADVGDSAHWQEPVIGAMVGEFYFDRFPHRRGRQFLFADRHRSTWIGQIRNMVLSGAAVRHDGVGGGIIVNEPHGTTGAGLLSEALPESRFILLVRDPRDVVASKFDAYRSGGWAATRRRGFGGKTADQRPDFIAYVSKIYLWDLEHACAAFDGHPGPKVIVRYEDLRSDPATELGRICEALGVTAEPEELAAAAAGRDWDQVPADDRGPGKIFRKATPGGWRDDLSAEDVADVELICEPILRAFYDGEFDPSLLRPTPTHRFDAARALWERLLAVE